MGKDGKKHGSKGANPKLPKPPKAYTRFTERFPELARAWDLIHEGGEKAGPMDEKTMRLVKLGLAIGSRQTGSVHSSVRKALAMGIPLEELEQVAALAAGTMGMSAGVAAFTWIHEEAEKRK
jgi:alkylhydroperoxidase/carboxymuconolactone decarboxylase family protein YurZ